MKEKMKPREIAVPKYPDELMRLAYAVKIERDSIWSMVRKLEECGYIEKGIDLCEVCDDTAARALVEGVTDLAETIMTNYVSQQIWETIVSAMGEWQLELAFKEAARRIAAKYNQQEV